MRTRVLVLGLCLPMLAHLPSQAAETSPLPAPSPTDADPDEPADFVWQEPSRRVDLIPHFNFGAGLPVGVLGLSLEARYGPVGLEAGAGFGFGGWQGAIQAWGHLFPTRSIGGFDLGIGYSTGDVQSRGDLGGLFGPDTRYKPAHWLNVMVAPTLKVMPNGEGVVVRAILGAMLNLAPDRFDSSRIMPMFGITVGWDIAL